MRRTTIYLEPDLEVLLKLEANRRGEPMAEVIREAVRTYLTPAADDPPGIAAFASDHDDTASDIDAALDAEGFGER
jgi:hypothetical protein